MVVRDDVPLAAPVAPHDKARDHAASSCDFYVHKIQVLKSLRHLRRGPRLAPNGGESPRRPTSPFPFSNTLTPSACYLRIILFRFITCAALEAHPLELQLGCKAGRQHPPQTWSVPTKEYGRPTAQGGEE